MSDKVTPGPWTAQALAGNHDYAIYDEASGKDLALVRNFHAANTALIVSACNACQQVNPENPQAVAERLPLLVETLRYVLEAEQRSLLDNGVILSDEVREAITEALAGFPSPLDPYEDE